jgi:ABC-type multidrug transport system fused ATPase/permease subunit
VLRIPFDITLRRGERLIVLGDVGVARYSLAEAFLGHLNIIDGSINYGGRIGYLPQVPFILRRDTVRNNVLFGELLDEQKLQRVYKLAHLSESLKSFLKNDETILEDISIFLSLSFRQKLALARTLYADPDIFIFDNVFDGVDVESLSLLLNIFDVEVPNKTLIITTRSRNFLRKTDKILIFDGTTAIEYGNLDELRGNPRSMINYW